MSAGRSDQLVAPEETVLFMDLLGFAALTEAHPQQHEIEVLENGYEVDRWGDAATQFSRFHLVIDVKLQGMRMDGGAKALIFSDCAFLVLGSPLRTAYVACDIMGEFLKARLPVRMGIGHGTFNPLRFSSDTFGQSTINRAMFTGTGVVRAHYAERCGGKGMRIFLHPSMKEQLANIRLGVQVLPLETPFPNAEWELNYLSWRKTGNGQEQNEVGQDNRKLFESVVAMTPTDTPASVKVHYTDTLLAINRMRGGDGAGRIRYLLDSSYSQPAA